jgi:hypothetical protein
MAAEYFGAPPGMLSTRGPGHQQPSSSSSSLTALRESSASSALPVGSYQRVEAASAGNTLFAPSMSGRSVVAVANDLDETKVGRDVYMGHSCQG